MESNTGILFAALCGGLFVLLFAGLGAFLIYNSIRSRKKAAASQGWPVVSGEILEARVVHDVSTDSDGDRRDSYTPAVRYSYAVGGHAYSGKKLSFGGQTGYGSQAKAQAALNSYPLGGTVRVYYNPADPSEAVLERQAGGATVSLVLGIIFVAASLCAGCPGLAYALLAMTGSV